MSILYGKSGNKPFSIFQCTASTVSVAVEPIRHFNHAMHSVHMITGYFLTTGEFTEIAKEFAGANNINLIDAAKIVGLTDKMSDSSKDILFAIAMGQEEAPGGNCLTNCHFCPACRTKMSLKAPSNTRKFWECPSWDCGQIVAVV